MKKIYQIPEMKVVNVQTAQMIAASPGYGEKTDATSGNLSRRRGSSWDDDDDDDDY